jgi:hypothetical protein
MLCNKEAVEEEEDPVSSFTMLPVTTFFIDQSVGIRKERGITTRS